MLRIIVRKTIAGLLAGSLGCTSAFAQTLVTRAPREAVAQTGTRLGPGDQVSLWVRDSDEISGRTYRVDEDGSLQIPLVGRLEAGGLTPMQLEARLTEALKSAILEPVVHVTVSELRSSPVTVMGGVKQPGVLQLRDRVTLLQALTMSGGPSADAGFTVTVTRAKTSGEIPLPSAKPDASGEFFIAEEDLNTILDGSTLATNLVLRANDIIQVQPAPVVYVMGEVKRSGGFALHREEREVSVLRALSLAEGMTAAAAPKKAMVLRLVPGGTRQGVDVDLKAVLSGQAEDLRLRPNDILYVPNNHSAVKTIAATAAQMAATLLIGVMVIRAGRR